MTKSSRHPSPGIAAGYMKDLEQSTSIAKAMLEESYEHPDKDIETTIYDGYGQLIDAFNAADSQSHLSELVPNVGLLKELLGDETLPGINDLKATDYFRGMRVARGLMLEGQTNKARRKNLELVTKAEIDRAIGAPSVDTDPRALAVGTAGHILERAIMAHLKAKGVDTSTWVKDQVLWALEDLALLQHAEAQTYGGEDAELFVYFTTPNDLEGGGMAWRKQAQVDEIVEKYQAKESECKAKLLEAYELFTGDSYSGDISDITYQDALNSILTDISAMNMHTDELLSLLETIQS